MATPAAFQPEPSSCFTAEMAATQGVYSRVNARKLAAVAGENSVPRAAAGTSAPDPVRTPRVEMTDSLAIKPVIRAVETRQSPKPRGASRGEIHAPTAAKRLWELSATKFSRVSKVWRNQTMMVAAKMMVKARVRKSLALSQHSCPTLRGEGKR